MSSRSPLVIAFLVLVSAGGTGCVGFRKALGFTQDLKKERPVAISQRLSSEAALCPGDARELIVDVALEDGRTLVSEGAGRGRVSWEAFRFEGRGLQVNAEGRVTAPTDPKQWIGGPASVRVVPVDHPHLAHELPVPLRFNCQFAWDVSGSDGADGSHGEKGSDAQPLGATASNGTDGAEGEDGTSGSSLTVRVARTAHPDGRVLLQVQVSRSASDERFFLIDPAGGQLRLRSVGGNGGDGGDGGDGGESTGKGGSAGHGGDGGSGGNVHLVLDEEARDFAHVIVVENTGGKRGEGGSRGNNGSKAGVGILDVAAAIFLGGDGQDGANGTVTTEYAQIDRLW